MGGIAGFCRASFLTVKSMARQFRLNFVGVFYPRMVRGECPASHFKEDQNGVRFLDLPGTVVVKIVVVFH
jgi:hypothetical protein